MIYLLLAILVTVLYFVLRKKVVKLVPKCLVDFYGIKSGSPKAVMVRGVIASSLEQAVKTYKTNIRLDRQKVLDGFTHVMAKVGNKMIDKTPKGKNKFYTEKEILSNL